MLVREIWVYGPYNTSMYSWPKLVEARQTCLINLDLEIGWNSWFTGKKTSMEKLRQKKPHKLMNDHQVFRHYFGSQLSAMHTPMALQKYYKLAGPLSDQSKILASLRKYCWSNHSKGSSFQKLGRELPAARLSNANRASGEALLSSWGRLRWLAIHLSLQLWTTPKYISFSTFAFKTKNLAKSTSGLMPR